MTNTPSAPLPPGALPHILATYNHVTDSGRGHVLIVSGPPTIGKTQLLRTAFEQLKRSSPERVIAGELSSARNDQIAFHAWQAQRPNRRVRTAVTRAVQLGIVIYPFAGLLSVLANAAPAALALLEEVIAGRQQQQPQQLVVSMLRTVANDGPSVCILDNADATPGILWRHLQNSFASEIADGLPLLLLLSLSEADDAEAFLSDGQENAKRLIERGLAEQLPLSPLGPEDIRDWLGRASDRLVDNLREVTDGRAGLLPHLWDALTTGGAVTRAPSDGRWDFAAVGNEEETVARFVPGMTIELLDRHLQSILGPLSNEEARAAMDALACAALEGWLFEAETIAHALERPRSEVQHLLESLAEGGPGDATPLLERASTVADDAPTESATAVPRLSTYTFRSPLHWYALRSKSFSLEEREEYAGRVADALLDVYKSAEWRVAAKVAELYAIAGRDTEAESYAHQGAIDGPSEVLLWEADRLLTVDPDDVDKWEAEQAAEFLIDVYRGFEFSLPATRLHAYLVQAVEFAQGAHSGFWVLEGLFALSTLLSHSRDYESALHHQRDALRIARETSSPIGEALAHIQIAESEFGLFRDQQQRAPNDRETDGLDRVEDLAHEALRASERISDPIAQCRAHRILGYISEYRNDLSAARRHLAEAARFGRERLYPEMQASVFRWLAMVEHRLHRMDEARAAYDEALAIEHDNPLLPDPAAMIEFGDLAQRFGDVEEAARRFEDARRAAERIGDEPSQRHAATLLAALRKQGPSR